MAQEDTGSPDVQDPFLVRASTPAKTETRPEWVTANLNRTHATSGAYAMNVALASPTEDGGLTRGERSVLVFVGTHADYIRALGAEYAGINGATVGAVLDLAEASTSQMLAKLARFGALEKAGKAEDGSNLFRIPIAVRADFD